MRRAVAEPAEQCKADVASTGTARPAMRRPAMTAEAELAPIAAVLMFVLMFVFV